MKITKKATSIKANINDDRAINESKINDAVHYINSAIDSLSAFIRRTENDESMSEKATIAQDCIVDLSTVLLTLKG